MIRPTAPLPGRPDGAEPGFDVLLAQLRDACPDPAGVTAALGGALQFDRIAAYAARFPALAAGPITTKKHFPHEAHARFAQHCVQGWTATRRPGLVALAVVLLRDKDIEAAAMGRSPHGLSPREQAIARAVVLVAARAEFNNGPGARNAFHNPVHTAHVATAAGYIGDLNDQLVEGYGRFVEYGIAEKLLIVLAAFAHDVDHPGRPNPPGDALHNENRALDAVRPLMRAAGMDARAIAQVETMVRATSPDGPHMVLRRIARGHAHREIVRADAAAAQPALAALVADKELTQMAAILADADIFASVAGLPASKLTARRLTDEYRRAGLSADFTTPQARAGFIAHIVGREGFASQAAMAGFNRLYKKFVAANDEAVKALRP